MQLGVRRSCQGPCHACFKIRHQKMWPDQARACPIENDMPTIGKPAELPDTHDMRQRKVQRTPRLAAGQRDDPELDPALQRRLLWLQIAVDSAKNSELPSIR